MNRKQRAMAAGFLVIWVAQLIHYIDQHRMQAAEMKPEDINLPDSGNSVGFGRK